MNDKPTIKFFAMTIDCHDPMKLAEFYAALTGWTVMFSNDEYTVLGAPGTEQGEYPCITFQRNEDYVPPVWPEKAGAQQQMAHVDFSVDDLEKSVEYALECGATKANDQFDDSWVVMFDPAGHPFCLCVINM